MQAAVETFEFQAEVNRLMDIIINSLYSNKDIFLRELISNASDALDKIRFLSLTEPEVLGEGEIANLEMFISVDHENKLLKIRDRGVGMTKEDLISNLGTIARSGTSSFIEKLSAGSSSDLIGQFGVGFYSVYLVADRVQVVSKNNDDKQYVWESNAGGSYTITEDLPSSYEDGKYEDLGRGTELRIYLREDVYDEYSNEDTLHGLIKKYSEFINFPINLLTPEQQEVQKPVDDVEEDGESSEDGEEGEEDSKVEEPEFTVVYNWKIVNSAKSIWTKPSSEVTDEEYSSLYNVLAKSTETEATTFLAKTHFKAEGDIEFKAILYVPDKPNHDYYDKQTASGQAQGAKMKLYVRRVFITDSFTELIPSYLSWMLGVVDSDTLPLNVSRETLQQHGSMKTIKKKLVRKTLDTIKKIDDEGECYEFEENEEDTSTDDEDTEKKCKKTNYEHFWSGFGRSLKMGFLEDAANRSRLIKLLRFRTSKSSGKEISLQEYVDRKKSEQDSIYFIADATMEDILSSPALEKLAQKDYEVLFLTDAIDEWIMASGMDFEDMKFVNVNSEDLKLSKDDEELNEDTKTILKKKYEGFLKWWQDILKLPESQSKGIEAVRISNRLVDSPATVVSSKYGYSANMDRILSTQFSQHESDSLTRKILEVNLKHPIIKKLKSMYDEESSKEEGIESKTSSGYKAKELAITIYQTSLIQSGFFYDKRSFTEHVYNFLKVLMDIDPEMKVDENYDLSGVEVDDEDVEPDVIEEKEEEEEEEEEHQEL